MTNNLKISKELQLPFDAVTNTFAILARKRVGKTYTASVIAEEMVYAGIPWVAIDPTGAWWGLRSSSDGKQAGLPVVVIGGAHGDVPLEYTAGKVIADVVVDHPGWYILDLSLLESNAQQDRFTMDFGEHVYRRKQKNRFPMHFFMDEADMVLPQKPQHGQERLLGAYEAIVRRGGIYGLGITIITQRPAIVNKNVLTQCETLIVLSMSAPQDQDAVDDWVKRNGTKEQRDRMMSSLASLGMGKAWFWSPVWLDVFKLVNIRERDTFNSSATPKHGEKMVTPKVMAQVDLEKLGTDIQNTIEKIKENDPAILKAKISKLEKEIKSFSTFKLTNEQPRIIEQIIEVPVFPKEMLKELKNLQSRFTIISLKLSNDWSANFDKFVQAAEKTQERKLVKSDSIDKPLSWMYAKQAEIAYDPGQLKKDVTVYYPESLPEGEALILGAIIQFQDRGLSPEQISVLTTYKRATRDKYLSFLIKKGLVSKNGSRMIFPTDEGIKIMPHIQALPTGQELQRYWLDNLPIGEKKILEICLEIYPQWIEKSNIDSATGQARATRDKYIGFLRAKYLIEDQSGSIRAHADLFNL